MSVRQQRFDWDNREKKALTIMPSGTKHTWTFRARFRRHAFGWRSQPAIKRVKEAVSEIKKAARKDPVLGGEGAVLFLEKISPALEHKERYRGLERTQKKAGSPGGMNQPRRGGWGRKA